jgi:glucokinase
MPVEEATEVEDLAVALVVVTLEDMVAITEVMDTVVGTMVDIADTTVDAIMVVGDGVGDGVGPICSGDGLTTPLITGDGHITLPPMPILFLQLLWQNRDNSNPITGTTARTHRVTTRT